MNSPYIQEEKKVQPKSMKELLKKYDVEEERRSFPAWQLWALEFCDKYEVKKNQYGIVMKYAKKYQDNLDYLRGVEGWISDYPNRRGGVIRLFLWKIKYDRDQRTGHDYI